MNTKTQISVFVKNEPGELSRLCNILYEREININAISIQNARDYLRGLYKMRSHTGRRVAPAANYASIIEEVSTYSIIRLVLNAPEEAQKALDDAGYVYHVSTVIEVLLENRPGELGKMADKFTKEGINIDYVYGSALEDGKQFSFIFHVADPEETLKRIGSS